MIGPYRILAPLSAGGMGVVYRARDPVTGGDVALKTVQLHRADLLHSIRREIHALRRLHHPGVVRVLDEGLHDGLPWYTMELLEGSTLRRRLDSWWPEQPTVPRSNATTWRPMRGRPGSGDVTQPAPPEPVRLRRGVCAGGELPEVLTLVRRLCEALAFIHGEGVVHRDLKPENIFLRRDSTPVLVDFGLVSAFGGAQGRESLEVGGSFEGSVHYVSPEQIDGKLVDARADLYALGCILYELVTGQPPFPGETWDVLSKQMTQAPTPPSRLVDGVPHALEDLILRLLAKQPRDRIGYATDVAAVLVELGAESGPTPAAAARPYLYRPEFAGRGELLAEMERRLDSARAGQGSMVLLAGDSGAGKTRLAVEIATSANRRGFRVVAGECLPVESRSETHSARGGPLHPFKSLLHAIFDLCRAQGLDATERVLGARGKLLADYEPSFTLLSGQGRYPEPPRLTAQAAQDRLIASLVETIASFALDEPLLLVVDDLQWADALSLGVLSALRKVLRGARVLLVGTYRTGEESEALRALSESAGVTRIKLGGLEKGVVATMVRDMLALPAPPESFIRFLTAQSEGNPFFVAEYLRLAISEGMLRRNEAGRWQMAENGPSRELLHELPLPRALRDVVGRRLLGLSRDTRFLVEVASVLGREFDSESLAQVACLPDQEVMDALGELLQKHIVEESTATAGRFRFAHDKLREVTYDGIPADRCALLHHAAAEELERRHSDSEGFGLLFPLLAHHWATAGVTVKTQEYLERAGERSLRTGANAEAADFFRRALALEPKDGSGDARRRAGWERKLGEALYGVGDVAGGLAHLQRALGSLGWPMPRTAGGWARLGLMQLLRQVLHLALPARWVAAKEGARDLLATVSLTAARLSECYYFNQQLLPTVALSLLAVNLAERTGRGGEIQRIYGHLAYLVGLGRLHVLARRYFARAQGTGQLGEDPSAAAFGYLLESMYHVTFGRHARSAECAREALKVLPGAWNARDSAIEKLEAGYVPPEVYLAKNMLAQVDFYEGRFEQSLQKLVEVQGLARVQSNAQYEAWTEIDQARGMIVVDRLDEAVDRLTHAQKLLAGRGDKSSELQSHGLMATAHLFRGELERAREVADSVSELVKDVQPAVFTEGCGFEGLAEVYLAAWERAGVRGGKSAKQAWSACGVLARFALLFPLARSASLRFQGKAHWLAGHRWRARRCWKQSLEAARKLGMPYEVALTQLELGRHGAEEPAEKDRLLREAREALAAFGKTRQLRELDAGKAPASQ